DLAAHGDMLHLWLQFLLSFGYYSIRPPPGSTLFPYTTLFRSGVGFDHVVAQLPDLVDGQGRGGGRVGHRGMADVAGLILHRRPRSEEHTSELQSRENLVCRLLLEKKKRSADGVKHDV